jgi:hypothetical protein
MAAGVGKIWSRCTLPRGKEVEIFLFLTATFFNFLKYLFLPQPILNSGNTSNFYANYGEMKRYKYFLPL